MMSLLHRRFVFGWKREAAELSMRRCATEEKETRSWCFGVCFFNLSELDHSTRSAVKNVAQLGFPHLPSPV